MFDRACAARGSAPAIVAPDGRVLWAFDQLGEAAARLAGGLASLGLGPASRVLILEPDRREQYRTVAGVVWSGATAVIPPLSVPLLRSLALAAELRPQAIIANPALIPLILAFRGLRESRAWILTGGRSLPGRPGIAVLGRHEPVAPAAVTTGSPALISFTTGTTGRPTPIDRSHGVLGSQHDALRALRGLTDGDRDFVGLPVLALHNLASGVTSILPPGHRAIGSCGAAVVEALVRTRPTTAAGFPSLFQAALRHAGHGHLRGLRSVHVGGTRVRPNLLTALGGLVPAASITVVYGSTEVEPIASIDATAYLEAIVRSDPAEGICVGRVIDGLELRIEPEPGDRPPDTTPRSCRHVGRIHVRGRRAAGGSGTGGWVDTGDLGHLDASRRLWLLGRATNRVGRLHPIEAERTIESLAWVESAALVRLDRALPSRGPGLLAVQPVTWPPAGTRQAWLAQLQQIATQQSWSLERLVLVRRMPLGPGPAAKVDEARLRRAIP